MSRETLFVAFCLSFSFVVAHFGGEFFNNLTADQKQQLETLKTEIKANTTLTKAQIKEQFDALIQSFGITPPNFQQNMSEISTKIRSGLSVAAQPVFDQITTIKENMNLTPAQEHEQIENIINNAEPAVKTELEDLKEKFMNKFQETANDSDGSED